MSNEATPIEKDAEAPVVASTPGPWEFVPLGNANEYGIKGPAGRWLIGFLMNGELMTANQMANGRLIAKAPDMLDYLVELAKAQLGTSTFDTWSMTAKPAHIVELRKLLKLIAKARGKSTFGNDWQEALS